MEDSYKIIEGKNVYFIKGNFLKVKVRKLHSLNEDYERLIKGISFFNQLKKKLNESYGNGFTEAGYFGNGAEPYITYKIIPLNNNLGQKVDKKQSQLNKNPNNRIIHTGDFIKGYDKNGNFHKGIVQRIIRDIDNNITGYCILSYGFGELINILPKTAKLSTPYEVKKHAIKWLNSGNQIIPGMVNTFGGKV